MTFHSSELGTKPRNPVKTRVEQAERIGPIDGEDRVDAPLAAMPDGSGFPCAAAVHHDDGGIVKAGIGIGAERVGQMVIHKAESRLGGTELAREGIRAAILVPHAGEMARGVQHVQIAEGPLAGGIKLQVVAKRGARSLPADANLIDLIRAEFSRNRGRPESQATGNAHHASRG